MPLDKVKGEQIGGLGHVYRVVPAAKWRMTSLFESAATAAEEAFTRSGALAPITFDEEEVLVQEYPKAAKLAFVFCKRIRGNEHFYPFVFDLPPQMIADLIVTNKWEPYREQ